MRVLSTLQVANSPIPRSWWWLWIVLERLSQRRVTNISTNHCGLVVMELHWSKRLSRVLSVISWRIWHHSNCSWRGTYHLHFARSNDSIQCSPLSQNHLASLIPADGSFLLSHSLLLASWHHLVFPLCLWLLFLFAGPQFSNWPLNGGICPAQPLPLALSLLTSLTVCTCCMHRLLPEQPLSLLPLHSLEVTCAMRQDFMCSLLPDGVSAEGGVGIAGSRAELLSCFSGTHFLPCYWRSALCLLRPAVCRLLLTLWLFTLLGFGGGKLLWLNFPLSTSIRGQSPDEYVFFLFKNLIRSVCFCCITHTSLAIIFLPSSYHSL